MRQSGRHTDQTIASPRMPYHIVSQYEHGGYRCEIEKPDLASAISATLIRVKESRRRHYIVDEQGKLIDIVQPA